MTIQTRSAPEQGTRRRVQSIHLKEVVRGGEALVTRLRTLAADGNTRRLTVLTREGEDLARVSLGLGVVTGGLLLAAPAVAALGVLAALTTHVVVLITGDADVRPAFAGGWPPEPQPWTADAARLDRPTPTQAAPI